jgi:hypothetical protein
MGFLSVLKSIGHVAQTGLAIASNATPLIAAIPGVGAPAAGIIAAVAAAEHLIPGQGQGAAKKAVVQTIVAANAPHLPAEKVSSWIDAVVALLKSLEAVLLDIEGHPQGEQTAEDSVAASTKA